LILYLARFALIDIGLLLGSAEMKKRLSLSAFLFFITVPIIWSEGVPEDPVYRELRERMVAEQLQSRDITDTRVLEVMRSLPRHLFVPEGMQGEAYGDCPVRIGEGQTISQPYVVALITQELNLTGKEKVLEIGTGSGYQAAVLSPLAREVYSIEIREPLANRAALTLESLGFTNIKTRHADGYFGWSEYAPFDRIIITASVDHIPPPLLEQLVDGGRMILPLGNAFGFQNLVLVVKEGGNVRITNITGVLFVPMTGEAERR
jgi:protein-L-isoaspartate(D-aspartate) O-methyltransferase